MFVGSHATDAGLAKAGDELRRIHDAEIGQRIFGQQFGGDGALGGWIRRIMVNTALSHLRRQRDFLRDTSDFTPFENKFHTDEDFASNLDAETLLTYLQRLPPGYRAVFNLYAIDGFSHEEIAEQLGISIGTSKSQLFKAREFLKRILDKSFIT
mgnify:CR=1 FL=1